MLVKLTTFVNFTNILHAHFAPKIKKLCFGFGIFWHQNIGKKSAHKMFAKLSTDLKAIAMAFLRPTRIYYEGRTGG
jgi:hypothetical protein